MENTNHHNKKGNHKMYKISKYNKMKEGYYSQRKEVYR